LHNAVKDQGKGRLLSVTEARAVMLAAVRPPASEMVPLQKAWGRVLAELGAEPGIALADIDVEQVLKVRGMLPSLERRGMRFGFLTYLPVK